MTTRKAKTYQQLSQELDQVMTSLQDESIDIETAVKAYEQGMSVVKELEKQLKTAENKVKKIKLQFE